MRNCLFCGIGVGVVLLIVAAVLGWAVFPGIIESRIADGVSLIPGTEQMDRFEELPQPLTFKVYLFNVLNADAIHNGAKPEVEEMGPYVYNQFRKKEDVKFVNNQRQVEFHQGRTYEFDADASFPLTEDDEITFLNVVAMGAYQNAFTALGPEIDKYFEEIFGQLQTTVFKTFKVGELMFGGFNFCAPSTIANVISYCQVLGGASDTIQYNPDNSLSFSFFKHKGNTFDGKYTINTGIRDPLLVGDIELWEDLPIVKFWNNDIDDDGLAKTSICNEIKGTDSSIYPPFRKTEGSMFTYSTDICRSVEIHYKEETTYEGITGYTYESGKNFLEEIGPEYNNECYCIDKNVYAIKQENGCLYPGALDLTSCVKSPIVLTQPHFLETATEYSSLIDGLSPNEEIHKTFVTVEKNSGTPLRGGKRVQFNMFIGNVNDNTLTVNLPTALLPLLWVDEGIALNADMVGIVKDSLSALDLVPIVVWTLFSVGLVAIIGFAVALYFTRNRSSRNLV